MLWRPCCNQERRAREKRLLASLQTLLFTDCDKAPTASEVTYNYVLECTTLSPLPIACPCSRQCSRENLCVSVHILVLY